MRDLQKDLAICNKATPGTWKRNEKPSFGDWWVYSEGQHICLLPADKKGTHYGEMFKANAEFITTSREGWPHAIGRAIKAEAEVAKLRAVLHEIYPTIAGRASQLLSAGEEKAAMQWGQMARLVYDAEGSGDR